MKKQWEKCGGLKSVAVLCTAALLAVFCACGTVAAAQAPASQSTPVAGPDVPFEAAPPAAGNGAENTLGEQAAQAEQISLGNNVFDFRFEARDTVYQLPCPLTDFLERGWQIDLPLDSRLAPQAATDVQMSLAGDEMVLRLANRTRRQQGLDSCEVVGLLAQAGGKEGPAALRLAGGLALGSARAQVLALCGNPDSGLDAQAASVLEYTVDKNTWLRFGFNSSSVLDSIELWRLELPAQAEPARQLPPEVAGWEPPTALGDSWSSFTVEYGGALYSLPAPVEAFLANGWRLLDEGSVAPGKWLMRVGLQKGNQVLRTVLHNYSTVPQPLEGCFVTMVECSKTSANVDLLLPGGLTGDAALEEIVAVMGYAHEVDASGNNSWDITYYSGYGMVVFRFRYEDDLLFDVEVWNSPPDLAGGMEIPPQADAW